MSTLRRLAALTLFLFPSLALANFVTDNTSLPATKTNLRPIPTGADATKYIQASDYNAVVQAAYDLRGAISGGANVPIFAMLHKNPGSDFTGNRDASFSTGPITDGSSYAVQSTHLYTSTVFDATAARTFTSLRVQIVGKGGAPPGLGASWSVTVYKSTDFGATWVASAITVAFGASDVTKTDSAHSVTVASGDMLAIVYNNPGGNLSPANTAFISAVLW